eukprot:9737361-Prorocentrum_lima.AAC.1
MSATLVPMKERDIGAAMQKASKAIKNLRSLIADESTKVSDDVFWRCSRRRRWRRSASKGLRQQ